MKKATILIFDGVLQAIGTSAFEFYTDPRVEQMLASCEKVSFHAQLDPASGTGLGTPAVTPQHSSDGQNYINMTALTWSSAFTPSTTAPVNVSSSLTGSTPVLDRLRLKISGTAGSNTTCRCKIWATLRDDG